MTREQIIAFMNSIFDRNAKGEAKFVATASDTECKAIPDSHSIRITASARGQSAVSLTIVVFEEDDTEEDKKDALTEGTAKIGLALLDILETKIRKAYAANN